MSEDWNDIVERMARKIYEGKQDGPIDPDMVKQIAAELMAAVFTGYGKDLDTEGLAAEDKAMLTALRKNVYIFSGFKNHQELREAADLLMDEDGKVKSWADFLADVKALDPTYNETYLRTERNTALTTSHGISRWQRFEKEKASAPNLTWVTSGRDSVCEVCGAYNGLTAPVDSPVWNTRAIPAHFNCDCRIEQALDTEPVTPEEKIPSPDMPEGWEIFQHNPAKEGVIFPKKHPYYRDVQAKMAKRIRKESTDLIDE
jgi:SPP1 gp7 family putative phage head morphogenesis protein